MNNSVTIATYYRNVLLYRCKNAKSKGDLHYSYLYSKIHNIFTKIVCILIHWKYYCILALWTNNTKISIIIREQTYTKNTGPARRPAWLVGGKWPSRTSFVVMVSLERFPCVRIFPEMKHWTAWVHLHRKYLIYRHGLNNAQPAGARWGIMANFFQQTWIKWKAEKWSENVPRMRLLRHLHHHAHHLPHCFCRYHVSRRHRLDYQVINTNHAQSLFIDTFTVHLMFKTSHDSFPCIKGTWQWGGFYGVFAEIGSS